jgi:hypothetical protein
MMEDIKISYPTPDDLSSVIRDYIHKGDLMNFLHSRGVFYSSIKRDSLSRMTAYMLYGYPQLEELRRMAHNQSSKSILTGFSLTSEKEFDFASIYSDYRSHHASSDKDYLFKAIQKQKTDDGEEVYKGEVIYRSKKAGRIEFIKEEKHDITFIARQTGEKTWLIEVDGNKSGDGKEVQKMIQKIVKEQSVKVNSLTLEGLDGNKPIIFFDRLAKEGMNEEWTIKDVTRITIRRPIIEETEEDEDATEISDEHLQGIKQAILDGKDLRENKFVKSSEKDGYIFSSMTYNFCEKSSQRHIFIRAEFKGNPKIFEVVLEDAGETMPDPNKQDPKLTIVQSNISNLSDKENFKLRSLFWQNARKIYMEVLSAKSTVKN